MKHALLLCIFGFLSTSTLAIQFQNCIATSVNYSLFDLCAYAQDPPFNLSDSSDSGTLSFTLGTNHMLDCSDNENIWGTFTNEDGCFDVAVQSPNYTLINSSDPNQGIILSFPIGQTNISGANYSYQLIMNLACDDNDDDDTNSTTPQFTWNSESIVNGTTIITVNGTSSAGCPVISLDQVVNFFAENQYIFAVCFGIIGLILAFFGIRLMAFALFIIPTILSGLIFGCLLFEVTNFGSRKTLLWVLFGISLATGIIVGILALKFRKFAYFVIGAAVGIVGGFLLYNAVISPIVGSHYGPTPLYITLGVSAVIGAGVGLAIFEEILVLATSLIGGYLIVRAASVFIGGFPAESYVATGIEKYDAATYGYLVAILVVSGLGMFIQFKTRAKREALAKEKEEEEAPTNFTRGAYYRL